jgi:hypothetical protein
MTEFPGPDRNIAAEIRALRHDGLYTGRSVSWEELRARIRHLLLERRPSPDERIELLELYDQVVTRTERRCGGDVDLLRRIGRQRAIDSLTFPCAEARTPGGPSFSAVFDRERASGRLRVDPYLVEALDHVLQVFGLRADGPPGVREDGPAFWFPAALSRPPASPPSPPSR